jgi:uncharacterized protein YcbK (DUF882 family)
MEQQKRRPDERNVNRCFNGERRHFLQVGLAALVATSLPRQAFAAIGPAESERSLAFYNTHTGERLKTVYWQQGDYVPEALTDINHILRDHLANEVREIEPKLLDSFT